jgi:hypothetical protein
VLSRPGQVRRSRFFPQLVQAARLMREHEIRPVEWVVASVEVWERKTTKGTMPPLAWTFHVSRLVNRHADEERQLGGQMVRTPALLKLLVRYQQMQAALRPCRTRDEALAVAAEHFPGDSYRQLVAQARTEAKLEEKRLHAALHCGVWIWGT